MVRDMSWGDCGDEVAYIVCMVKTLIQKSMSLKYVIQK